MTGAPTCRHRVRWHGLGLVSQSRQPAPSVHGRGRVLQANELLARGAVPGPHAHTVLEADTVLHSQQHGRAGTMLSTMVSPQDSAWRLLRYGMACAR